MPTTDINAGKMALDFMNTLETAEQTTDFWVLNTSIVVYVLLILVFLGLTVFLVFAFKGIFNKASGKR